MSDAIVIKKEMALTHGDFFRLLSRALRTDAYSVTATSALLEEQGRRLRISLGPEGERRIALLRIPATMVTLTFTGYAPDDQADALAAFDQAFRRGGG
jgi:hypothetical protein